MLMLSEIILAMIQTKSMALWNGDFPS